jgi:hypothetical protein
MHEPPEQKTTPISRSLLLAAELLVRGVGGEIIVLGAKACQVA